jgi:phospholipid/cholesterol/gamma-HCH transport system ATP-binding protein
MIDLVDVHKQWRGQPVLRGLDLRIAEGGITALIGESGSGKSVLFRHIVGLVRADSGRVLVDGADVGRLRGRALRRVRDRFGVLFQEGALFDSLTVFDNVAFPLREKTQLDEGTIVERVARRLDEVGLAGAAAKLPAELSGGMRKRAALARALIHDPEIALFDEPTTGLDPIRLRSIQRLIRAAWERLRFTGVIVSHDIPEVFEIADTVAMIHEGRIVARGTPDAILASRDPIVRRFLAGGDGDELGGAR